MLTVLFIAGTHSTFLVPAKEGILPQMFPDADSARASGLLQFTVYTMTIAGPVVTGLLQPSVPDARMGAGPIRDSLGAREFCP